MNAHAKKAPILVISGWALHEATVVFQRGNQANPGGLRPPPRSLGFASHPLEWFAFVTLFYV